MRSSEELIRKQHPIFIPDLIWRNFFRYEISPIQLKVLSKGLPAFEELQFDVLTRQERQALWLALNLHSPNLSINTLIESARKLALGFHELFILTLYLNNDDLTSYLLNSLSSKELNWLFKFENYKVFYIAAMNGKLSWLQYFAKIIDPDYLEQAFASDEPTFPWMRKKYMEYAAVRFAAENGQLAVLEFIFELFPEAQYQMISANNYKAFYLAAKRGHIQVLRFLLKKCESSKIQQMLAADHYKAFRKAVSHGHEDVVLLFMQIVEIQNLQEMFSANQHEALIKALSRGHYQIVARIENVMLTEEWDKALSVNNFAIWFQSIKEKNLFALQFLTSWSTKDLFKQFFEFENYKAIQKAAAKGNMNCFLFLINSYDVLTIQDLLAKVGHQLLNCSLKHSPIFNFVISRLSKGQLEEILSKETANEDSSPNMIVCLVEQIKRISFIDGLQSQGFFTPAIAGDGRLSNIETPTYRGLTAVSRRSIHFNEFYSM